ncbi:cysteine hydrolase family protein [Micromonospora sp. KC723]|uniref:cysteine hydrolase family protein n=1 Tax=Micromonospora sp. KC723 TaxID=2530381 RepID=UPI001A9E5791|nr:isochorismatase family protein [Micromonospora sp. KC723]
MKNALVIIDVQESFQHLADWHLVSEPNIVGKVNHLADWARARGDYIVWVLGSRPGTGTVFDPELGFVRLMDGLDRRANEPVLLKNSHNAFTTTSLHQHLTRRGIRGLTICGIKTEQCCETTARIGSDLGFDVTFAIDATATCPIPHPEGNGVLSVRQIRQRTEYVLSGRFAAVRTVADLTGTSGG